MKRICKILKRAKSIVKALLKRKITADAILRATGAHKKLEESKANYENKKYKLTDYVEILITGMLMGAKSISQAATIAKAQGMKTPSVSQIHRFLAKNAKKIEEACKEILKKHRRLIMRLVIVDSKLVESKSKDAKVGYSSRLKKLARGFKVHLKLQDELPEDLIITPANVADISLIDCFLEENCIYVLDAGYLSANVVVTIMAKGSHFVMRFRKNIIGERKFLGIINGVKCWTIRWSNMKEHVYLFEYPNGLQLVASFFDPFLARELYALRCVIEIVFKFLVRINAFPKWVRNLEVFRAWVWSAFLLLLAVFAIADCVNAFVSHVFLLLRCFFGFPFSVFVRRTAALGWSWSSILSDGS